MSRRNTVLLITILFVVTSTFAMVDGVSATDTETTDHILITTTTTELAPNSEWKDNTLTLNGVNVKYINVTWNNDITIVLKGKNIVAPDTVDMMMSISTGEGCKKVTITSDSIENNSLEINIPNAEGAIGRVGMNVYMYAENPTLNIEKANIKIETQSDASTIKKDLTKGIYCYGCSLYIKDSNILMKNLATGIHSESKIDITGSIVKLDNPKPTDSFQYTFLQSDKGGITCDIKPNSPGIILFFKGASGNYEQAEWGKDTINVIFTDSVATTEKPSESSGMPIWAIILIVVVVILILAAIAYYFLVYKKGKSFNDLIGKKKEEQVQDQQQPPAQ